MAMSFLFCCGRWENRASEEDCGVWMEGKLSAGLASAASASERRVVRVELRRRGEILSSHVCVNSLGGRIEVNASQTGT